jgi:aspartyl-tRNA(Asn)/glutamyl-tRNA(Gln) amidotransferase subunit B
MADLETVIGLEVHVELATESKAFCSCRTKFGAAPNSQVCPVCMGLPGTLPVLNRRALEYSIRVGLALECRIARRFKFDRKHYYYPDLPKNFQISQYDVPLSENGRLKLSNGRTIRVKRVHLEEDAGKLVHEGAGTRIGGGTAALVDLNRAGVPLLEIVSEPDLHETGETVEYLKSIQTLVRYLGVSDGNMEEGSLRCDANISVRPAGTEKLGAKVEIKNMNSFKSVERALVFEADRQRKAVASGEPIIQETRLYDEETGATKSMRGKEGASDYRYFPEPDLPPFTVDPAWEEEIRKSIPELPAAKRARFVSVFGLPEYDASVLAADRATGEYFDAAVAAGAPAKQASNWVMTELLGALNAAGTRIADSPVAPRALAGMLALMEKEVISGKIAKTVFAGMFATGQGAEEIVKEQGLVQITDTGTIRTVIAGILAANPASVADFKAGKKQAAGFLVGQVMKATEGKANPAAVNKLLQEELNK